MHKRTYGEGDLPFFVQLLNWGLQIKNKAVSLQPEQQTFSIMKISSRLVKAFEKFDADVKAFGLETNEDLVTLYEDAYTTRVVKDFQLTTAGRLTWVEQEMVYTSKVGGYTYVAKPQSEQVLDEDDAREWLSFWRANLRRAKRYWAMSAETLDRIQDGEMEDTED